MNSKTVYIAGPVFGKPNNNKEAFDAAAEWLEEVGAEPVSPLDIPVMSHSGDCPGKGVHRGGGQGNDEHVECCYLRADLSLLVGLDGILMLPGWQASAGACLEHQVAIQCGHKVFYSDEPYRVIQQVRRWIESYP